MFFQIAFVSAAPCLVLMIFELLILRTSIFKLSSSQAVALSLLVVCKLQVFFKNVAEMIIATVVLSSEIVVSVEVAAHQLCCLANSTAYQTNSSVLIAFQIFFF